MAFGPPAMGYDRALTIFSPDGKLYQVEYAAEAVRRGWTALGIMSKHGAVIMSERRKVSVLHDVVGLEKVFIIDTHIGATFSGLGPDGRVLIDYARNIAMRHRLIYDEPIDVEYLVRTVCDLKQVFTQQGGVRPFGVSLIFAGTDRKGVSLFKTEPNGLYFKYFGVAVGSGEQPVNEYLEKHYKEGMSVEDLLVLGLRALRSVSGEPITVERVDVGYIRIDEKVFHRLIPSQIAELLDKAGVSK